MSEIVPFISAEPLFAEVREMMSSYLEANVIDDAMFPIWTKHCLNKFSRSGYPKKEIYLQLEDYEARLPNDFKWVREAWVCANVEYATIPNPSSLYYQMDCRVSPPAGACDPCEEFELPELSCDPCDQKYTVVHKVTGVHVLSFNVSHLLKPATHHARACCVPGSNNLRSDSYDTFDIRDGKIVTNFTDGDLYLEYYADHEDGEGAIYIPDEEPIKNYIFEYLIYMCYRKMVTVSTPETFNQMQVLLNNADRKQGEAYIEAKTYKKKETPSKKRAANERIQNKFNHFRPR